MRLVVSIPTEGGGVRSLGQTEKNEIMMQLIDTHETDLAGEVGGTPPSGELETDDLAIELERTVHVANLNSDVSERIYVAANQRIPPWRTAAGNRRQKIAKFVIEEGMLSCPVLISSTRARGGEIPGPGPYS